MAKITFRGLDDYETFLSRVAKDFDGIVERAVYEGAAIAADTVRREVDGIPIVSGYGTPENPLPGGVTAKQKQGLLDGLGISPMQNNAGYVNVKIGFDGYNSVRTEKYPKGQPNALVARGVNSGTSWKCANPFMKRAKSKATKQVCTKMREIVFDAVDKLKK